ncbi:MAG: hypothetical protein EHM83_01115 [Burkholderiales bacterium]|nr:MAG: hypothetical protein EHM83_01115 [Burkholderiales bacterium]
MDPQDLLGYRRIETRTEARAAFDRIVSRAQRSLRIADDRGEFYGFDRKAFADALEALLGRGRDTAVEMILHDPSFVERSCPRVVALLRQHTPRLRVLRSEESARQFPRGFVLVDDTVVLRRPHHDSALTFVDFDEQAVAEARTLLDDLVNGATAGISANVTGL